jgi:hypothetical protein
MKFSKYVLPSLVIGASLVVGASDVLSTHMELLTPIREKGGQVRELITKGFAIFGGVSVCVQIARGCYTDHREKKIEMFKSAAWIAVGAAALSQMPNVFSLLGINLG